MAKAVPRYALFCDEAGGPADAWRSLAVVSGPLDRLLSLEQDLREALKLSGLEELKWTNLRKRPAALRAAGLALELATAAARKGGVRFQLWCWESHTQPQAWRKLSEPTRMQAVYGKLLPRAARSWRRGRWLLLPDERTGVDWKRLQRDLGKDWRKAGARIGGLYPVDSRKWALVQCCDLLAGLLRHSFEESRLPDEPGGAAHHNRNSLLQSLLYMSHARKLGLGARHGLQGHGRQFSAQRVQRWV